MSLTKKSKKKVTSKSKGVQLQVTQGAIARKAIRDIELLFKRMDLTPKSITKNKRQLIGTFSVPTQLIQEVAAAAEQYGTLLGMPFDSEHARETLAYASAFEPVATKAEAFAQRVRDSILAAKSDVGAESLAVYASMKGIVRRPAGAPLRDSFDKMTQIMKVRHQSGKRRTKKAVKTALAAAQTHPATIGSAPPATVPATAPAPVTTSAAPPPAPKPADKPVVVNTAGGIA